ncbi:MAG: NAD(P)-dependent oxidoreductase [Isosphaeraceae bacterium]|nr:NAD(P)-dependent oxidoreductase [Isosphaeraceae bacterium]
MSRTDAPEIVASSPEPVGLIGLGLLGGAMAERLSAAGTRLVGFDIDAAACGRLVGLGGMVARHPAEVAASCARVMLCLPDDRIAAHVVDDLHPEAGRLVIDFTTGDPRAAEASAVRLAAVGVDFIDATVLGSSEQMRRGEATLFVAGAETALDRARDIFGRLGAKVYDAGVAGDASRAKLVVNLVLGLNRAGLAEGLAFAESLGLPADSVLTWLREGPAASRIMDAKGPMMLERDYRPRARLSQHHKDVRLMIAAAEQAGIELPLTEAHARILARAEQLGLGDLDNAAIIEAWRRCDRLEPPR